jgi:hypothetical protein
MTNQDIFTVFGFVEIKITQSSGERSERSIDCSERLSEFWRIKMTQMDLF